MTDLIVDGNSLYARCFMLHKSGMDGVQLCVEGLFFRTMFSLLGGKIEKPDRMLICWDGGERKTDKKRAPKPPEYHEGLQKLQETVATVFGCRCYQEGEADDTCAVAAYESEREGNDAIILTSDKDLFQCVSDNIKVYSLAQKQLVTKSFIRKKWGVEKPIYLALYLAIHGDKTDGIDGLAGYGKVKTEALMRTIPKGAIITTAYMSLVDRLTHPQVKVFEECLAATLLPCEGIAVPRPRKLKLCSHDEWSALGIEQIDSYFSSCRRHLLDEDGDGDVYWD